MVLMTLFLPFLTALSRQEESAKLLEDKVRRAEAEARELEEQRAVAEQEKKKISQDAMAQKKDNEAAVSLYLLCDVITCHMMSHLFNCSCSTLFFSSINIFLQHKNLTQQEGNEHLTAKCTYVTPACISALNCKYAPIYERNVLNSVRVSARA